MPEVTVPYPAGTPCWVSLLAPDQQAALAFYRDLFGWSTVFGPPEAERYAVCMWHRRAVAGIGRSSGAAVRPGAGPAAPPTAWTTFFAADDADATARAVTANGGALLLPVQEMPQDTGRMFVAADPSGAVFGVWQPRQFFGAEIVNEPGAVVWNELNSRDLRAAAGFYPRTIGVTVTPYKEVAGHWTVNVAGRAVGGLRAIGDEARADTPSHWLTYFSVADTDGAVEAVVRARGAVRVPAHDTAGGRAAVVTDPQGADFGLIARPPTG